jgi:predicted MFS family arabinose efflux permease
MTEPGADLTSLLTPERERLAVATLAAIQFVHIVDFVLMMPLGPLLMRDLGVGTHEFGLLISSYTFTAAISGLLVATFVDRFERRRLVTITLALFALATLSCALATGFWSLLAARGAAGAFGGVLGGMVQTMVGDIVPFQRRGRASGAVMSAFSVATIAGVPASLWIANHFGWRLSFVFLAVLGIAVMLVARRALPRLAGHLATAGERAHPFAPMAAVLRDANHLRALAFICLLILSGFTVVPYISIYIVNNVGVALADIPLIYFVGGFASLLSSRWIGRMADRHGKIRVYRLVAAGSLLPILLITHLLHLAPLPFAAVLAVTTLFFVFVPGRMVPGMAIVTSAAQPALRGTFLSLNSVAMQIASGLAATIGGLIIAAGADGRIVGYEKVGYVAAVIALFAMAWVGRVAMHGATPGQK